ncbi:MAG: hypothetical protein K2P84_11680 [Undibacterium sp.]|nr:hypothetical protein [Undibacterium sp.]
MENQDNGNIANTDELAHRRSMLRSLGYAGLLAAGVVQMAPAMADTKTVGDVRVVSSDVALSKLDRAALTKLNLTGRLPANAAIEKMYLTPEALAVLTPAAKLLSKADLVSLSAGKPTAAAGRLTVTDIGSIRNAFGTGYMPGKVGGGIASLDVSCCCCTPCCCAAAVNAPVMQQAA